jgi:hypothetical protein
MPIRDRLLTSAALLAEIDAHITKTGISESYLGLLAVRDTKLVGRLRAGGTVTLEKAAEIIAFIEKEEKVNPGGRDWNPRSRRTASTKHEAAE